jgi:hypothetical protein
VQWDAGDEMRLRSRLAHLLPPRALSSPAARVLVLCSLIWLLCFGYGRFFLWRDPHSAYFRSETVYDLGYSAARQNESRAFVANVTRELANHDASETREGIPTRPKTGPSPAICAAFVTVRRDSDAARLYLADALGSMLAGLDPRERAALNVSLLFADTDPARHPDWRAPWVRALADSAAGYVGVSDIVLSGLRQAEEERDLQLKGVFDYLYMLERCLDETSAPFVAVFEDDLVFAGDWMARTMRGLQHLVRTYPPRPPPAAVDVGEGKDKQQGASVADAAADWLYLRLFYTETHLGWATEGDWWYRHLSLTLLLAAGATAALLSMLRALGCGCGTRQRLDWPTVAVVSLLAAPAFVALMFMAGKHNVPLPGYTFYHEPFASASGGVVPMDQSGCCTQALVFNRRALPPLVEYLRRRGRGQTDSMIEDYCNERGVRRFALGEQAVQHVGLYSSRGMPAADTRSVWAFWFEASKSAEVERRHRQVVEQVDWAMFDQLAAALGGKSTVTQHV